MTAPDYVAQVAELLREHTAEGTMNRLWCNCGWEADHKVPGRLRPQHAAHQAEVLAAAGLIPTSTEWGVRHSQGIRLERHERTAREELGPMLATFERNFRDKVRPTVVSRAVTHWKDAT